MYINSICTNPDLLGVFRIIKIVILIIKIAAPITLILSIMIGYVKAIKDNDSDALNKANKNVVPKLIAAILIFFIPTFVNTIAGVVSYDKSNYLTCIKNANTANINKIYISEAQYYTNLAKEKLSRKYYDVAMKNASKIKTPSAKIRIMDELASIDKLITAKEEEERRKKEEAAKISHDVGWWWPIGGKEIVTQGGVEYAPYKPVSTSITATFAGNDSVHKGLGRGHGAIDIGASRYTYVIASRSGVVTEPAQGARIDYPDQAIKPDENGKYNCAGLKANTVTIDHGDGTKTSYKHLYKNTITVKKGDYVRQGQIIGRVGSSGCSTGPHLHFEVYVNGKRVDPLKYVSTSNTRPNI